MEKKFDIIASQMSTQYLGKKDVPWLEVTKGVLLVYMVLVAFSSFYRPDFMSLTAVSLGMLGVESPHLFKRKHFRMLVIFVVITFLFDFMHLFVYHDSREDDEADSGNAGSVRMFSYFFVWISFFFRPVVAAVLWKDSLEYMRIIKQRNSH